MQVDKGRRALGKATGDRWDCKIKTEAGGQWWTPGGQETAGVGGGRTVEW